MGLLKIDRAQNFNRVHRRDRRIHADVLILLLISPYRYAIDRRNGSLPCDIFRILMGQA